MGAIIMRRRVFGRRFPRFTSRGGLATNALLCLLARLQIFLQESFPLLKPPSKHDGESFIARQPG